MSDQEERSVAEQLDELQRLSEHRRRELHEIAAELPATMSRRAILRAVVVDFRRAPNKGDVFARGARKLAKTPRRAYREVRHALRRGT